MTTSALNRPRAWAHQPRDRRRATVHRPGAGVRSHQRVSRATAPPHNPIAPYRTHVAGQRRRRCCLAREAAQAPRQPKPSTAAPRGGGSPSPMPSAAAARAVLLTLTRRLRLRPGGRRCLHRRRSGCALLQQTLGATPPRSTGVVTSHVRPTPAPARRRDRALRQSCSHTARGPPTGSAPLSARGLREDRCRDAPVAR
jgi:hypothetical protein